MIDSCHRLEKSPLCAKDIGPFIVVVSLGIYHVLSALALLYLSFRLRRISPDAVSYGLWAGSTGVALFASVYLIAKGSKYSNPCFAYSLISASLINYNTFKVWFHHKTLWGGLEWLIVGSIVGLLFIWWSRKSLQND
jgi:hypothetical protein